MAPKGRPPGAGPPPRKKAVAPPSADGHDLFKSFPLPKELVLDSSVLWEIGGERQLFKCDAQFEAAFSALGSQVPEKWKPVTRESFNKLSGWQQKQLVVALRKPLPWDYAFPHAEAKSVTSLSEVDWASCVGVQRSSVGSEGVLFVELANRQAVIVKAPVKIVAELYGNRLCERLRLRCPRMRVVELDGAEGRLLLEALVKVDAKRPECDQQVTKMLGGRTYCLVAEYVSAKELAEFIFPVSSEWSARVFGLSGDAALHEALNERGKSILRTLGAFLALDMLINNFDRLPCVWDNLGNPGNVMFVRESGEVVAIDNVANCLHPDNADLIRVFLERVERAVFAAARYPDSEQEDFAKIREVLRHGSQKVIAGEVQGHGWPGLNIDIGTTGVLEVQRGFFECARRAVYGEGDSGVGAIGGLAELQALSEDLLGQRPGGQKARVGENCGLETYYPRFSASVLDVFQQAMERAAAERRVAAEERKEGMADSLAGSGAVTTASGMGGSSATWSGSPAWNRRRRRQAAEEGAEGKRSTAETQTLMSADGVEGILSAAADRQGVVSTLILKEVLVKIGLAAEVVDSVLSGLRGARESGTDDHSASGVLLEHFVDWVFVGD